MEGRSSQHPKHREHGSIWVCGCLGVWVSGSVGIACSSVLDSFPSIWAAIRLHSWEARTVSAWRTAAAI